MSREQTSDEYWAAIERERVAKPATKKLTESEQFIADIKEIEEKEPQIRQSRIQDEPFDHKQLWADLKAAEGEEMQKPQCGFKNDSHLESKSLAEISTELREDFRSVEGTLVDTEAVIAENITQLSDSVSRRGAVLAGVERKTHAMVLDQGRDLSLLKKLTPHGEWVPLLKTLGIGEDSAQRHMKAYALTLLLPAPDKPAKTAAKKVTFPKVKAYIDALPAEVLDELRVYLMPHYH
jgi:hypothetical protein